MSSSSQSPAIIGDAADIGPTCQNSCILFKVAVGYVNHFR